MLLLSHFLCIKIIMAELCHSSGMVWCWIHLLGSLAIYKKYLYKRYALTLKCLHICTCTNTVMHSTRKKIRTHSSGLDLLFCSTILILLLKILVQIYIHICTYTCHASTLGTSSNITNLVSKVYIIQ